MAFAFSTALLFLLYNPLLFIESFTTPILLHSSPEQLAVNTQRVVVLRPSSANKYASSLTAAFNHKTDDDDDNDDSIITVLLPSVISRRKAMMHSSSLLLLGGITTTIVSSPLLFLPLPANARLEGVNKPELLPSARGQNVIQVEKFLTTGQEKRMNDLLTKLETDTGYRVRVLCQAYPRTPGLAIRDYWDLGKEGQKDDKYVVLVVDQFGGKGNVLNFNVGEGVKFALPNVFWTRLTSKYGTTFYVKENGIDLAITNAIEAIVTCLRSEDQYCVNVPEEGVSLRSLGM